MNIVRKSGGPRVVLAWAAFVLASVLMGAPVEALGASTGQCPVTATADFTPGVGLAGAAVQNQMRIDIRGSSCVFAGTWNPGASIVIRGALDGLVAGPCNSGQYSGPLYVTLGGQTSSATGSVTHDGASLTLAATGVAGTVNLTSVGELAATQFTGGCPTGWLGVVLVEKASV